ncbi:MAG: sugar phosphate isomerase/epimerase [Oscillospiraceae bacterium]|nr:sugar phosphate isomerase/epimerase [Oscillospiraceae bacterium]
MATNQLFYPFSLVSNISKGHSLPEALDITKQAGFGYVEPASIYGMCEHFTPAELNEEFATSFKEMLEERGLNCYAVSGHVDLTIDSMCDDFIKKVEFAGRIGASIINTNSGPKQNIEIFYKNMKKVIDVAERYGVIIGLESHGDIISTAKDSVEVFKHFNHPLVRFNYDTGNTLFYSEGTVKIEEDILYGLEYMSYLHLKDIKIEGNKVRYCCLGEGDVNLTAVLQNIKDNFAKIPVGLEIPVHVKGVFDNITPTGTPMLKKDIYTAVDRSLSFLKQQNYL